MGDALPIIDQDPDGVLTDRWQRRISYLRVSLTDRCNYRCGYCMPLMGWPKVPRDHLLTIEEIERFVGIMARLGLKRVRLTGGEPLLRRGVPDLVRHIAALEGIAQLAMTTNGHLLPRYVEQLYDAGLRGLNVSLDSFDTERFAQMTRGGDLEAVVKGLEAAGEAGFEGIKLNAVVIRGVNDHEVVDFCKRSWDAGWVPRFIELMPIGVLETYTPDQVVPTDEMVQRLQSELSLASVGRPQGQVPNGPAAYWAVTDGPYRGHKVGIISPMSDDGFCAACNRARLTARGGLRACLADDSEVSFLHMLRNRAPDDVIIEAIQAAVTGKRVAHRMRDLQTAPRSGMTGIGG
ncbi:MAG: GTP 3',8-cyclase MoaA [Bradymonadia bacterium]